METSAFEPRSGLSGTVRYWVYGTLPAALLLLALAPAFALGKPAWQIILYLHLPAYMLHQFEEHNGNRFATFLNGQMAGGREILTPLGVFLINIPLVWGLNALSLLFALFVHPAYGLAAIYLVLVNGLLHIAQALRQRRYNPGLATSILLFLPLSVSGLVLMILTAQTGLAHHLTMLALALLLHLALVLAFVARRFVTRASTES